MFHKYNKPITRNGSRPTPFGIRRAIRNENNSDQLVVIVVIVVIVFFLVVTLQGLHVFCAVLYSPSGFLDALDSHSSSAARYASIHPSIHPCPNVNKPIDEGNVHCPRSPFLALKTSERSQRFYRIRQVCNQLNATRIHVIIRLISER